MSKMSKALIARIKFRYDGYYESKSNAKVKQNAMKMAANWSHEYPTGTPLEFIRDDIIACWERTDRKKEDKVVLPPESAMKDRLVPRYTPAYTVDTLDE